MHWLRKRMTLLKMVFRKKVIRIKRNPFCYHANECVERKGDKKTGVCRYGTPLWDYMSLFYYYFNNNQSLGPAATNALPASLPVNLVKLLMKRLARSFAFSFH